MNNNDLIINNLKQPLCSHILLFHINNLNCMCLECGAKVKIIHDTTNSVIGLNSENTEDDFRYFYEKYNELKNQNMTIKEIKIELNSIYNNQKVKTKRRL